MRKVKVYLILAKNANGGMKTIMRVEGTRAEARNKRDELRKIAKEFGSKMVYEIADHTILEDNECAFRAEKRHDLNTYVR